MRATVIRSLLVVAGGAAILAGVLYVASTVDARPPTVLGISVTQPVAGDPQVALITTSIEVAFSEPVAMEAAAAAVRVDPDVPGSTSWSGSTLIFTPAQPLDLAAAYTVSVADGVVDLVGNEMGELPPPFEFETAGRPTIAETTPADGASDVAIDEPIGIEFSTLMDTAAVERGLELRPTFPHELRWSGELLEILPTDGLAPNREYTITIAADVADIAGVAIGTPLSVMFRTVAPGLAVDALVPSDGVDGVAPATSIAVIFDRAVDADSLEDGDLVLSPAVAGTLDVVALPDDPDGPEGEPRMLRFTPSGPLPANTTFDVSLAPGVSSAAGGGGLTEALEWSFTTGSPPSTISNQITFLSDRAGVTNVWVMNPDGTGERQLSAELASIVDYAVAPDGSSLVVGDGRHLIFLRADGSERRVLTDDAHLEFDPAYAPNGQRVAFARADAIAGTGLGLWSWEVGAGEAEAIDLPDDIRFTPRPTPSGEETPAAVLRAPRYAPDGQALAFVDTAGFVGILELPAQRLTSVPFTAGGAPAWLPDSSGILVAGSDVPSLATTVRAPVRPLEPDNADALRWLGRSATEMRETGLPRGWRALAISADGTLAYVDDLGQLATTTDLDDVSRPARVSDDRVLGAAFAPGEDAMVIIAGAEEGASGRLERLNLRTGRRTPLAPNGSRAGWWP